MLSAQEWTKKDSIWLQNVLSGKEKIQLNPETQKAIKEGSFLNTKPVGKQQISKSSLFPIQQDFSNYVHPEYKEKLPDNRPRTPNALMHLSLPSSTQIHTDVVPAFILPKSIAKEGRKPTGISFNDILTNLLVPRERKRQKARKRAAAFKY